MTEARQPRAERKGKQTARRSTQRAIWNVARSYRSYAFGRHSRINPKSHQHQQHRDGCERGDERPVLAWAELLLNHIPKQLRLRTAEQIWNYELPRSRDGDKHAARDHAGTNLRPDRV